jgi:hypothetical protein
MQGQQRRKEPAGPVQKPFVFSQLNNGQSSFSGVNQGQMITRFRKGTNATGLRA